MKQKTEQDSVAENTEAVRFLLNQRYRCTFKHPADPGYLVPCNFQPIISGLTPFSQAEHLPQEEGAITMFLARFMADRFDVGKDYLMQWVPFEEEL